MCSLQHQTGAQYIAVECTRDKVLVRNVVAPAPQPEPANRLKSVTRDVSFLQSDSRCRRYASDLSNVTPRYLGSEQKGRVSLLRLTMIKCNFEKIEYWCHWKSFFDFKSRFTFDKTLRERLQSFWRFHLFCSNGYLSQKSFYERLVVFLFLSTHVNNFHFVEHQQKPLSSLTQALSLKHSCFFLKPCLKAKCRQINSVSWSLQFIRSGIQKVRPKGFANICRF